MPPKKSGTKQSDTYDILIVGAGISGFYAATRLIKSGHTVALADKYKFLGGRTFTYKQDISGTTYQWEEGAARISNSHTLLLNLVRKYGLTLVPIEAASEYKESGAYPKEPNWFDPALPITFHPLLQLPRSTLATSTIRQILKEIHGEKFTHSLLNRYPYRAEIDVMRADMGLEVFKHEFKPGEKYSVLKEGFSELIARIRTEFEKRGGVILPHHEFVGLEGERTAIFKKGKPSEGVGRPELKLHADRIILALPSLALETLPQFSSLPFLKHLVMKPLLRVFAVFPKDPTTGKVWFEGMKKFVTATPIRYCIPNDSKTGSLQISYTDSTDAEPLMAILKADGEAALGAYLVSQLRILLEDPDGKRIPDPLFVKAHSWKDGVTYWLPGDYDPYEESRAACRPFPKERPNLFLCGESYSTRQCWVEGALEHTELMLKEFASR